MSTDVKGFKNYYGEEFLPMHRRAEDFISQCKLEEFTREKLLNIMTAFALESEAADDNDELKSNAWRDAD